jgi:hypothetical protein
VARFAINGVIPFITVQYTRTTLRRKRFPWQSALSRTNFRNAGPGADARIVVRVTGGVCGIDTVSG